VVAGEARAVNQPTPDLSAWPLAALGGLTLVCAGVIIRILMGQSALLRDHGEKLVRLTTILTGPNGDNGINGEVWSLHEAVEELRSDMAAVFQSLGWDRRRKNHHEQ
jgi:hypothetical protein